MSKYRQAQCDMLLAALNGAGQAGMTRRQFAEVLGIAKSQHLNSLIKELVVRELAIVKRQKDEHNRKTFFYFPVVQSS